MKHLLASLLVLCCAVAQAQTGIGGTVPPAPAPPATWWAAACWVPIQDGMPIPTPEKCPAPDPKPPPAVRYVVAKNSSYPDRPTYPVTNGVRGTKSDGRVNVGTACDCSKQIVEGKTTYCPRAAAPGGITALAAQTATSVAVCTQAGP